MSAVELGPIGIAVDVTGDSGYLDAAAEMEKLGYEGLWVSGGQLADLTPITELVHATESVPVIPGIIPLDVHDAATVARLYADLEASRPGRFVVGLGGPQRSAKPLRAMNEVLDRLDVADPPVPAERRILAALGPRKLALARDRFAGAVTLLVTPEYTAYARETLGPDATLVVNQMLVLDDDASRARRTARETMGFLLGVAGYADNARRMGYTDAAIGDLSDRIVDDLTAWGDPHAVAARVRAHLAAGADQVVLSPLTDGEQPGGLPAARELAGLLLR
ncbi:MAG: TIGR03620 family F420-dependent LLM class oxidoreductase [Streptosporangiales bacterium]|nr:TIGR03620 family F420-dependent LLM class oxidoreductase [Streptosporangiales bacterium]